MASLAPVMLESVDQTIEAPSPPLAPGQLTDGWRWIFTSGWSLLVPALMVLGDASHSLGKPTWWLDGAATVTWWTPVPFLPLLGAAAAGAVTWKWWPLAGTIGVAGLGLTALLDASRTPSIAAAEAVLAFAGLATTLAACAGRVRLPEN